MERQAEGASSQEADDVGVIKEEVDDEETGSSTTEEEDSVTQSMLCPICLQTCVHPVELPCSHIFCFLCIKGVFIQDHSSRRCAICRQAIPHDVLRNPRLKDETQLFHGPEQPDSHHWFYESRSGGWWKYDERTMQDLEKAYDAKQLKSQFLIVGQLYEIDFEQMIQYPVNNRNVVRRIKRDAATAEARGVAGLRLN